MTEVLTIDEINRLHPDEWVLIGDPETDDSLEILRGKVLFHGKSREEMYRAAKNMQPPKSIATHFTGELLDAETVYVL